MTDRRPQHPSGSVSASGVPSGGRGPEHRLAATTLAGLLLAGGLMGSVNLLVDGVLRDGAARWVYAGAMALCLAGAVPLLVRQRAGRWQTFALVVLGDVIYVVVALCVVDPVRYASPLMLLFPAFVAAWFLGPRMLAVNMVLTVAACTAGLWRGFDGAAVLAVQVCVGAGMLNLTSLGVFVLRRRVQGLLATTQALARTDPLTGLANRRFLVDSAGRVWGQARREGARIAAMVLDLDHFKQLNDVHGHAAGDAVLRAVARELSTTVRPSDVLARIGGEELVVLSVVRRHAEASRLAERLRSSVARTRSPGGHAVTASIGFALGRPGSEDDPAEALWRLISRADAAMYEAKQQGRDRVAVVRPPRPRPARVGADLPLPAAAASDVA